MSDEPFRNVGGRPPLHNDANPATVDASYDPATYYTRASDARGHSHSYRLNLPKDWVSVIAKVIQQHPVYESNAALIRDAVFHRLKYLIDNGPANPQAAELLRRIEAKLFIENQAFERQQCEATLSQAEDSLREMARNEYDAAEMAEALKNLAVWADSVPLKYRVEAEKLLDKYGN